MREDVPAVSSRDRQNQSNRAPYDAGYGDDVADDDVFIDEGWADDDTGALAPPARGSVPAQPPTTSRPPVEPTIDGTAAQIDRLRRAMRQGPQAPPPPASRSRAAQSSRPTPARKPPQPTSYDQQRGSGYGQYDDVQATRTAQSGRARVPSPEATRQPAYDPYTQNQYGEYDNEYDDVYGEYEDDFTEYDEPRRPTRPQISMPPISRPSLPPAIRNAALVNDASALGFIGTGIASLVAMAILVANRVDELAPGFATHVSASGVLEDVKSETALWNLPLMATMLTLMTLVMAWFIAPIDRFASRFVLGAGLLVQFVTWVALIRIL